MQPDAPPPPSGGLPPAGAYGAPPAPGAYGAPPAAGAYGAPPAPGMYGAPPAPGAYGAPPAAGAYGAPPAAGAYGAPPAAGAYGAPAPGGYGAPAPAPGGYGGYGGYGGASAAPAAPPQDDYKRPFHKGGQHVLGRDRCPFYHKMGACRHGDRCTKVHDRPSSSRTIVIPMMYPNPKVIPLAVEKGGRVMQMEYDKKMLKKHIEEFYEDVFCTVMEFGRIVEMRVVDNLSEHLLGNVYIKFENEMAAQNAVEGLNAKMYNDILLLPELCPVNDFTDAICKEVDDESCKRGIQCNYWHPTPYPKPDSVLLRDLARAQDAHWSKIEKKRERRDDSPDAPHREHRREEDGVPAASAAPPLA